MISILIGLGVQLGLLGIFIWGSQQLNAHPIFLSKYPFAEDIFEISFWVTGILVTGKWFLGFLTKHDLKSLLLICLLYAACIETASLLLGIYVFPDWIHDSGFTVNERLQYASENIAGSLGVSLCYFLAYLAIVVVVKTIKNMSKKREPSLAAGSPPRELCKS